MTSDYPYSTQFQSLPVSLPTSERSFMVTLLLCFFLGSLGIHRFYVGKVVSGILMLVTLGFFGIWTLIDFILIICQKFTDDRDLPVRAG